MSNFTCPTCGFTNIDCGKDGYKTTREIELEKKLKIAIKALKKYANALNWDDCLADGKIKVNAYLETAGYKYAEQALKEIENEKI